MATTEDQKSEKTNTKSVLELDETLPKILAALNDEIDGEVLMFDLKDDKYNAKRKQWNVEFNNYYPLAIIMMESESDICKSLKSLFFDKPERKYGLRVRSAELGGHLWNGYSVANNSIIFDLSRFNSIKHIKKGIFKVGVGCQQGIVNNSLKPFFRIIPTSGDCPQFSFGGFIQGGGLSLFLRSFGIAADHLIAADIILPSNGQLIHATMNNEYNDILYGIKGGGAGNFGIVTNYYIQSLEVPKNVLSFEVYWDLPNDAKKIEQFLSAWNETQSNDNSKEWTSWLVVLHNGSKYIIRMLGIWNGNIDKGYKEWEIFNKKNGLEYNKKDSNIIVMSAYNAVDIHQSTFAGDDFRGIIDARTVKSNWNENNLLADISNTMIKYHNQQNDLKYIWLFVRYGGSMYSNDPKNKETAFGNRDAKGDITLLITYDDNKEKRNLALEKIKEINQNLLTKIGKYYYPNHPRSYNVPDNEIRVAYYDYDHKPALYEKLQSIKKKYDPNNLLQNPVTIRIE